MVGVTVLLLSLAAETGPSLADVLAYGKRLDVSRLDSRLGSERYQTWLERVLGRSATVTWSSDDCGEGVWGDNALLCVTADAHLLPRGRVVISIAVGSVQGGLVEKPSLSFARIEGLGPSEIIGDRDLPLLASKLRAAQALSIELSRRPDVPIDDHAWIRQVQRTTTARLVHGGPQDLTFGDWVAARAGSPAKVEWFVAGCGRRGNHGGPPVDLTGDKDEWAFVDASFEDSVASVLMHVRVGTCRKGPEASPVASTAQLFDKRRGRIHIEQVPLDALDAKLREIHAGQ